MRNKQRLLRILRYLYENTDEDHPVKTSELVEMFSDQNAHARRKTIQDDIRILEKEGYDIETIRSYYYAYYMRSREFELPELKLLIDAVSSSRFITKDKSEELIEKLSGLASKYQAEKLVRHIYTAERLKPGNENIYYIVDQIVDAINEEKKVAFKYFDYTPKKEKVLRRGGEDYIVSPYGLIWDDNHYYMIGYFDHKERITTFRVDRVSTLGVIDEPAIPRPDDFDINDYAQSRVNMFSGELQEVVLQCENEMMKSVIDQFGEDVESEPVNRDFFRATVKANVSQTFFAWVFRFNGRIWIHGPADVREQYREMLQRLQDQLPL